jgi:hypothetical protein
MAIDEGFEKRPPARFALAERGRDGLLDKVPVLRGNAPRHQNAVLALL